MKKLTKSKILLVLILLLTLTGCTKPLRDENNKAVRDPRTGQSLTANIVCKPTNEKIIKLYKENGIKIDKLPDCNKMSVTGKYENLWNTFFVRPLAYIIVRVGKLVGSTGLGLILITLAIRLILFPVTRKTAMQSELIKKAQPEFNKLEKKYEGKTDQDSVTKKGQEMMAIYKKYNINPLSGCLFAFLQLPLLFAFIEAINRVPAIFEGKFLGLEMGMTPWIGISNGHYLYLILPVLIVLTTYFSFNMNNTASMQGAGQNKTMMIFMTIFIGFMSFTLSSAIGIYWVTSSAFTVFQNLLTDRSIKNGKRSNKR